MKSFLRSLGASLAFLFLAASLAPSFGAAALVVRNGQADNVKVVGYGDATAGVTFNSTSYADLTGASLSYVPTLYDCTTAARLGACLIEVAWSADATKATSTTGTCAVYVNGAIVASSARTTGLFANAYTIGGDFMFANSTVGTQTVKIQCKSADTAVLTVTNAHIVVKEIIPPYAR